MLPNTKQRTFLLWVNVICLTLVNVFGKSIDYDEGCFIEDNVVYVGGDIMKETPTTTNLQECSELSVSIPGGLFWTWRPETKKCYVKGDNFTKEPAFSERKNESAISGNKRCGQGGCVIEYDIYYEGDKITQKTTKNLQECVERSVSIPGGLFWTWHEDTKHCFIKGEVSGKIKHKNGHEKWISGNKECGPRGVEIQ